MCLGSPKAPKAPAAPAPPPNFEAVSGKRKEDLRRQMAAFGDRKTVMTSMQGVVGAANTGKTTLGA